MFKTTAWLLQFSNGLVTLNVALKRTTWDLGKSIVKTFPCVYVLSKSGHKQFVYVI
jgi:hypothetical protein